MTDAPFIPYGRQDIRDEDVSAVDAVLRSDFLTQGPAIAAFEAALTNACEAPHAIAVSSATAALHIACMALGLGPGDHLWTSPISFVASANCGLYCGASVDFVDIDPATALMDVDDLERRLITAKAEGRLPKVLVPVHFAGHSCDMARIGVLAKEYGFRVVEDASHCIGGHHDGQPIGSCAHSDICVFSFHPVKIVTSGEGGAALTRNPELAARMNDLRTHGITREASRYQQADDGPWYYEQQALGYNYRITDIQAALGTSQMTRLSEIITARHSIAARYDQLLAELPLRWLERGPFGASGLHLYVVLLDDAAARRPVFDAMRADNIGVNVHYIPIHLQPFYRQMGFAPGRFPAAEDYYSRAISIPMFPGLTDGMQDRVVQSLARALGTAG
ncbi:UDP-4-amino-4,6-dideoxy-N-acetyl-beta-L-altrosamine transaminase [Oceanomicrobium pacificus]|uniref:UDP-4-amino-4, 6-dideoxy-N-acetyl-beta-L-altrosamine transaminase n=1 Tax=Oceanomicrobium pacificus TaxID=2692916 RepID=A0A6B0TPM5_9RHOB|nr:UDP-4-amino-4,6-dideoxy-N-acetyl-beta-L-altrosamine transaminase [Oceanomicrobium pacificus]MXU66610.1 UDP-4-amino-4,6-dideoxy-N-acetyl-beta-L-altrosamine transaminase [Oceanomicrobium pacificus]